MPPPTQPQSQPTFYSEDIYCKSHPDEEVRYFCFDCLTPPVCSECVVHGIHKGHDVLHIKKAFPQVKEKLDSVISGLMNSIEDAEGERKGIITRKHVISSQAEDVKSQVKTVMDDLRNRIEKKEHDLMASIDNSTGDQLKELESYERVIEEKLATLSNNVKYIQENMQGGPLPTLSFYADNNKLLVQAAEQESHKKDPYAARLLTQNSINPEQVLREVKDAAAGVVDGISKLKIGPNISSSKIASEKKGFDEKQLRDSMEGGLNDEYN